jgi:hypothetical protein
MSDEREHVFMVALVVRGPHERASAEWQMHAGLASVMASEYIAEWWVCEDDRRDGSDNDSAVFVPKGTQVAWTEVIHATTTGPRRRWFGAPRKRVKR